jgi:hypothetical protein
VVAEVAHGLKAARRAADPEKLKDYRFRAPEKLKRHRFRALAMRWVLTEVDSDKARRLRAEFQNPIHERIAPDVFPVEVAHGLAKAERRGVVPQGDVDRLFANILGTPSHVVPICPGLREHSTSPPWFGSGSTTASTWLSPSGKAASS